MCGRFHFNVGCYIKYLPDYCIELKKTQRRMKQNQRLNINLYVLKKSEAFNYLMAQILLVLDLQNLNETK